MTQARRKARDQATALREEMAERLHALQQATSAETPPAGVPNGDTRPGTPVVAAEQDGANQLAHLGNRVDITLIDPDPEQPRKFPQPFTPDDPGVGVEELAASIKARGLLQAIVVRRHAGRYQVLVGERRLRAFRLLEHREPGVWSYIPAHEWTGPTTPATRLAIQILENDQREQLDPASRRDAYLRLRDECGGNASLAIRMLGIGRTTWYRVVGELDPDDQPASPEPGEPEPASRPAPKAASRLSIGQVIRVLQGFDDDRLARLSDDQARELKELLDGLLGRLRDRRDRA